ncbi:MAG: DUF6640 family protein [Parachlamydiaceae bacterium]
MMYSKILKYLISFCALITIIVPSMMDLNSTHMTNPLWAPHARFHWSIQWYSITFLNGIALYLLWGKYEGANSRLAIVFASLAPMLFWGSFFPSLWMPGTSPWPDGMEPFAVLPPNVYMAVVMTCLSGFAIWWDGRLRRSIKF